MIALCLGSAASVWADLAEAEALLGDRPRVVVACNDAAAQYGGRLLALATHHPDHVPRWLAGRRERGLAPPEFVFIPNEHPAAPGADVEPVAWDGSSGLYTAQVALSRLGARGAILCGVPLGIDAGHIANPGPWSLAGTYRSGVREALLVEGGRLRSMCGWTRDVLGAPTSDWITALTFNPED